MTITYSMSHTGPMFLVLSRVNATYYFVAYDYVQLNLYTGALVPANLEITFPELATKNINLKL